MGLWEFLESKGQEYAPFDPTRAKRIYTELQPFLHLKNLKIIHILGTNGKGSTGRFVSLGLLQNGYKVLHFSSPHLWRFNERFYLNGKDVSDDVLECAHSFLQTHLCVQEASYFEYATFLGLYIAQGCDFLVLEAGLGGEFDSTSVLKAHLSYFTPIGIDHKEFLGDSIESIAATKLRAMGENVLLAPQNYPQTIHIAKQLALQKGARLFTLPIIESRQTFECIFKKFCAYFDISNSLDSMLWEEYVVYTQAYEYADFLAQNLLGAVFILAFFDIRFSFSTLSPLNLKGRCERVARNILCDVGHNVECARALKLAIEQKFKQRSVILVYNTYFDKEVHLILEILKPYIKELWIFPLKNNPRVIASDELKAIANKLEIPYKDFMLEHMNASESYVVFGSFSVVAEFLKLKYTIV